MSDLTGTGIVFGGASPLGNVEKLVVKFGLVCAQMDLMPFVNKAGCECLNESDDCGFDNCLVKDSSYLESDCDEQVGAMLFLS